MNKIDLSKEYKTYFTATDKPQLVTIGRARFVSITGKGNPSAKEFADKIAALYSTAYAVKFNCKEKNHDFTVSKLEAQWWFDEQRFGKPSMEEAPIKIARSEWQYRLLIRLPDFVIEQDVQNAVNAVITKKGLILAEEVNFYEMEEGKSVQMLHIGPFDTEPQSLALMNVFIKENSFSQNGFHHEIYLSDFRKVAPGKMKTILREPVC